MQWIIVILVVIGYFVIGSIADSNENFNGPVYGPKDFETVQKNKKSHADWVAETNAKARKCSQEYDRMWADEYLDEHDC